MIDFGTVRVVDVTLRDGGYRNNFDFGMAYIKDHVRLMQKAGVDFIEIGYRNGSAVKIEGIGRTGLSENDYIEALREACPQAQLGVIAHAHNITDQDVHDLKALGVKLLRLCLNADNLEETVRLALLAKQLGLTTTINVVRISSYTESALAAVLAGIAAHSHAFDVVYTADSNGNQTPEDVDRVYRQLRASNLQSELGFHAHDNIGQAMANTLMALENHGVSYVDASLLGMGKGIGNLRLEQLIAFLQRGGASRYNTMRILCAADRLRKDDRYVENPEEYMVDVVSGLHNLSIVEREQASSMFASAQAQAFAS